MDKGEELHRGLGRVADPGACEIADPADARAAECGALQVADMLLARARYDDCERYLDEAFRSAADDARRADVEERRAQLARKRGDISGAIAHGEQALRLAGRYVPGSSLVCAVIVLWEVAVQVLHVALPRWFIARRARDGAERERFAIRVYGDLHAPYVSGRGVIWAVWVQLRARNLGDRYPAPDAGDRDDDHPAVLGSSPGTERAADRGAPAASAQAPVAASASAALDDVLRQLKATQEQLLHAGRMAAVGTLIAGLAHELNNPLTVIIGNVEHLRAVTGDDDQIVRVINAIDRQAKRAARLVNTLLRFSRTGGASREEVAPHELVRLVVDLVAAEARRREIELRVTVSDGLSPLFAARHEIESALVNLATNALQATPEGGVVELSAAAERRDGTAGIRFVVRDTGVGIAPEILPQIFDPFFTTKPEGEGTGLGLSLSREIASAHGGELTVDSVPGQGTTMSLWLPEGGSGSRSRRTPLPPR